MTKWLLIFLLMAAPAWGDVTGWNTAGTVTTVSSCWVADGASLQADLASDNNSYAVDSTACQDEIKATNFGFTTGDVPASSTINGITIRVIDGGGQASQSSRRRISVQPVDAAGADTIGSIAILQMALGLGTESTNTYTQDDLASALWSDTWADTDVIDTDFGVRFEHGSNKTAATVQLEMVEIQIVFTPPAAGGGSVFFLGMWERIKAWWA